MTFSIQAQETRTPNGIYDERHNSYALTHGTIYKDHATRLEDATLVFRDGLIVSIKAGGEVPAGFVEIDLGGRFVYPGLIDLNTSYGLPEPAKTPALAYSSKEILATTNHGAYNPTNPSNPTTTLLIISRLIRRLVKHCANWGSALFYH